MTHRIVIVHALTGMHPGTGQGVGLIDLPVARERATEHPLLPGSSLKGVWRDQAEQGPKALPAARAHALFGPPTDQAHLHAGALQVSDARVLLFPVQSDRGTFAWVSCPYVLERLARDSQGLFSTGQREPLQVAPNTAWVGNEEQLHVANDKIVLDGLPFTRVEEPLGALADSLAALVFPTEGRHAQHFTAWNRILRQRLCLVDDDSFTWFVKMATEVRARVRLNDETGTVARGGLWYEETLPPETVLAGLARLEPSTRLGELPKAWQELEGLLQDPVQLGGHASTGQGVARVRLHGGGA